MVGASATLVLPKGDPPAPHHTQIVDRRGGPTVVVVQVVRGTRAPLWWTDIPRAERSGASPPSHHLDRVFIIPEISDTLISIGKSKLFSGSCEKWDFDNYRKYSEFYEFFKKVKNPVFPYTLHPASGAKRSESAVG